MAPETEGHGTDAMIKSFHTSGGRVRKRVPFVKAITSVLTISSGGSAGIEGPVAQVGSGFGALVVRLFKVSVHDRRFFLLSGTAAGLGAIFKAPLGGALTAVEVLYKEDFESEAFIPCIVASVLAYTTYCQIVGYDAIFSGLPRFTFNYSTELLAYAALGVLCAPISWFYVKFFYGTRARFRALNIPRIYKPAMGGLLVGTMFYIKPEIIAGGWNYLYDAMQVPHFGYKAAFTLFLLAILKVIATSFTVGSGGSGGIFGPSLFIGGMLGGAFGILLNQVFPGLISAPGAFVLVGMGAFFAGAGNAPIASVVMVCELTGNYNLLAPLMLASVIHSLLSHKWGLYENQVENKFESKAHRHDMQLDILQEVKVSQVMQSGIVPQSVQRWMSLKSIRNDIIESSDGVMVVKDVDKVVGILDVNEVRKAIFGFSTVDLVTVEDLMEPIVKLHPDSDLHQASLKFIRNGVVQIPVINNEGKVVASLKYKEILSCYDRIARP